MKKFTRILICLMLCVVSLAFVACDKRTKQEKAFTYPSAGDSVYGNGGLAVRKGNYLYYVNGFLGVESSEHVQNGEYVHGALMLVKLNSEGYVDKGGNELLTDNYYITMSEKLSGFEATSLFIAGDYLYFTSPCQENEGGDSASNNKTEWAKERVDFNRIKLDKSSNVERIYRTEIGYADLEFEYYANGGNAFIMIYENGTNLEDSGKSKALIRVDCNTKSIVEVARNVNSVDFTDGNNIFFTYSEKNDGTTSYYLKKYNVFSASTQNFDMFDIEPTVKFVGEDNVFITYSESSSTVLVRYSIETKIKTVVNYAVNIFDDLWISETGDEVIAIKGNKIHFLNQDDILSPDPWRVENIEDADAESITVIGLINGCVIYLDNNNNLKSVSYSNCLASKEFAVSTIATLEDHNADYFDMAEDDNYLYFYKTVGNHEYLHRIKIVNNNGEAEEMVGVYLEGDVPTEGDEE